MYCKNCGAILQPGNSFCTNCGASARETLFERPPEKGRVRTQPAVRPAPSPREPDRDKGHGQSPPQRIQKASHSARNAVAGAIIAAMLIAALIGFAANSGLLSPGHGGGGNGVVLAPSGYTGNSDGTYCPTGYPNYDSSKGSCFQQANDGGYSLPVYVPSQQTGSTPSPSYEATVASGLVDGQQLQPQNVGGFTNFVVPSAGWTVQDIGADSINCTPDSQSPAGVSCSCTDAYVHTYTNVVSYSFMPDDSQLRQWAARGYQFPDMSEINQVWNQFSNLWGMAFVQGNGGTSSTYCISVFAVIPPGCTAWWQTKCNG